MHKRTGVPQPPVAHLQDAEGFPQVDRDLLQVEELSQKLRTKASRLDQAEEGLAASRLLAQQGVNVHRRDCWHLIHDSMKH